jgi:uncharacterized protein YlzI (FlbEa/FlbD family)
MHAGWLRLTQTNGFPVIVWATDVEMVAESTEGTIVYLHHDKVFVRGTADSIIESVDAINEKFAAEEAK